MSVDSSPPSDHDGPSIGGLTYPLFLLVTLAFLGVTILLGVATKAAGAGLACDANWPLCDGGVLDLFPATFPSFFEWIHRVVAMIAGFLVIGAAAVAWRHGFSRAVRIAVTIGLVLLPLQVILGRETVLSYEITILNLHFWTGIALFTAFVVATVLVWRARLHAGHVRYAAWLALAMVPLHLALSPLFIERYSETVQTTQYAVTEVLLVTVLLAAMVGWWHTRRTETRVLLAGSTVLTVATIALGREALASIAPVMDALYVASALALATCLVGVLVIDRRTREASGPSASSTTDASTSQ